MGASDNRVNGVAVFTMDEAGLMFEASAGGHVNIGLALTGWNPKNNILWASRTESPKTPTAEWGRKELS